jgi:hypothetical protein
MAAVIDDEATKQRSNEARTAVYDARRMMAMVYDFHDADGRMQERKGKERKGKGGRTGKREDGIRVSREVTMAVGGMRSERDGVGEEEEGAEQSSDGDGAPHPAAAAAAAPTPIPIAAPAPAPAPATARIAAIAAGRKRGRRRRRRKTTKEGHDEPRIDHHRSPSSLVFPLLAQSVSLSVFLSSTGEHRTAAMAEPRNGAATPPSLLPSSLSSAALCNPFSVFSAARCCFLSAEELDSSSG